MSTVKVVDTVSSCVPLRSIKGFLTFIAVINGELIAHYICRCVPYILCITTPLCLLCVFVPRLWNSLPDEPKSANLHLNLLMGLLLVQVSSSLDCITVFSSLLLSPFVLCAALAET